MKIDEGILKSEFLDEFLSIAYMYNILVKNPRKKVNRLSFDALLWIILSLICIVLLKLLSFYYDNYRMSHLFSPDPYCKLFLVYATIMSIVALSVGIYIHFNTQNLISKLIDEYRNHYLIIEEDFLEFCVKGEKHRLELDDILFLLINKYSLCFFTKNPLLNVAVDIKYKNKVLEVISEDIEIIDNSNLY